MKKNSNPKKALVTGASGKIGINLVRKLILEGVQVYALSSNNSFIQMPGVTFLSHTWGKPITFPLPEVDVIFHLASQTSAYAARQNVDQDIRSNLLTTVSILNAISHLDTEPLFIFAGSMTEYGMSFLPKIDETEKLSPRTFYETSKICSQLYIEQYARENIISKCITLRLSNVYGGMSKSRELDRGFIDKSIDKAISGAPLLLYGNGKYVRDYIHISDVVEAFHSTFKKSENLPFDAYNIGTGVGTSILSCLQLISSFATSITGKETSIILKDFPKDSYDIEKRDSVTDSSSFSKATGWKPEVLLENGIKNTIEIAWSRLK